MRVVSYADRGGVGLNMTPMIDVVFLLIIFFLLSSHLARQETQLELPLPAATSGQEPAAAPRPRVTINVLADGVVLLAGHAVAAEQLPRLLAERRQRSGEDMEVRIRCDRRAPYGTVEPVMRACVRAGIWNVTYAVFRAGEVR